MAPGYGSHLLCSCHCLCCRLSLGPRVTAWAQCFFEQGVLSALIHIAEHVCAALVLPAEMGFMRRRTSSGEDKYGFTVSPPLGDARLGQQKCP